MILVVLREQWSFDDAIGVGADLDILDQHFGGECGFPGIWIMIRRGLRVCFCGVRTLDVCCISNECLEREVREPP